MVRSTTFVCFAFASVFATIAVAAEPIVSSQDGMHYGGSLAKAAGDTIDLMGPGGLYPYRGDFETAAPRPGGSGYLTDGWTAVDETSSAPRWQVESEGGGGVAWLGDHSIPSCDVDDPAGGYGNMWFEVLEFRKAVPGAATVRVQADLRYDTEAGYDFIDLMCVKQGTWEFGSGSGGPWDGHGVAVVDYTFSYTAAELYDGTEIVIAFVFESELGWSDEDCRYPTAGAAVLDNITVTVNGTPYVENFDDYTIGPDWVAHPPHSWGRNYARVWSPLGDVDDCASNYSQQIAFIDDGIVVPGGTHGLPGNDYGTPGGYIVNNSYSRSGSWPGQSYLSSYAYSPVMNWPDPAKTGMSIAFDVYRHELLIPNDSPGIFYDWGVRSASAGQDINDAAWRDRGNVYYGGPGYLREIYPVDDLIVPGATQVQVKLGAIELGWQYGYGDGTNGTPAPYFDNVRVKVYAGQAAYIAISELRLANDAFPANGTLNLANLGANSVRFDMASNISPKGHMRNDPGDSICINATPRAGGTLDIPMMKWQFAVKNPLFTDAMRTALTSGQMIGEVLGKVTRDAAGTIVGDRYNFDLPDTGMLFPGDVLHYYFQATDHVAGDTRISTAPANLTQLGNPTPMAYPSVYTVNCLPSLTSTLGAQPPMLFWNDFGFSGGESEWYGALGARGLQKGVDYDVFATHAPSSGVGNGLGGRATVSQIARYTDMLYSAGYLTAFTLSNGDYAGDPSNDLGLLNGWLALGGRDLFLTGDDLAYALNNSGVVARTFLQATMGLDCYDGDVRDVIGGQTAPLVVKVADNPVFTTAISWVAYGGCAAINDFDDVWPRGSAIKLAQFSASDGVSTPYSHSAATLNISGTNRVVSMPYDLRYVIEPANSPVSVPARAVVLNNVLYYFGVVNDPGDPTDVPSSRVFSVAKYPNPFNPSLTIKYTLKNPGDVVMKVFNIRGELVKTLINGQINETAGSVVWDGTNNQGGSVPSGVYFVETRSNGDVDVQKATMVK